jgi:hypothetical protein
MSSKYWLLFGALALGAAQTVACTSEFSSCEARRICHAGASGMGDAGSDGGEAGADEGGSAGRDAQAAGKGGSAGRGAHAGESDTTDDAGSGGMAGDSSIGLELAIAPPTLAAGKTYAPFTGKLSASGAAHYTWSITSGALPAGLTLQGAQSATVTIAGTPTEAGQFLISLSVTDGSTTKAVDVTLVITHSVLFLSDRRLAGVNELFVADIGGASAAAPVQLSASIPSGGGVSSYAWSPDGSKVLYLAAQSAGGAAELWVASLAAPGTAQRVSAPGVTVSQMVWLGAGNIAAYSTGVGDTYLTALSAVLPAASKLAISGHGIAADLRPSPNGVSLGVNVNNEAIHANEMSHVTWAAAGLTVVPLPAVQGSGPFFSYDGRYAVINSGASALWLDLSLPTPIGHDISSANGVGISWSPNAQTLFMARGAGPANDFSRGDFTSAGLTITALASASNCGAAPVRWSSDGRNGLYGCAADVRGISNLATAVAGTDFSLLPSGFLSNAFTDTPSMGWSPDSAWIALRADRDVDKQYDLQLIRWSTPGVAHKPHANSIAPGVTTWSFAPNSQSIAFVGTIAPQNNAALYLSKLPAIGAPPTATLISAPASSVVQTDINWLPGSHLITYRATVSGASQLFAVPVAADGTAGSVVSISGVSGSGVSSYQLAPAR